MAHERTLFERLLDPDDRGSYNSRERRQIVVDSVVRHLRDLLNTRQGSCKTLSDYGMPEFESKSEGKVMVAGEMEKEIRNTVEKYEPRLRRIRVHMDETDEVRISPRFIVTAKLAVDDGDPGEISFCTVVDPLGQIEIV